MIACPSCGRDNVGVESLAVVVEERLRDYPQAFEVAVMGCAVNGPGEAGDADFGIAGGRDVGFVYAHGRVLKKVSSDVLIDELFREIDRLDRGRDAASEAAQDGEARRARDGRGEPHPARVVRLKRTSIEVDRFIADAPAAHHGPRRSSPSAVSGLLALAGCAGKEEAAGDVPALREPRAA